jgi:uncharacterized membrane protein YbhN (UPF0104 family)
MRPVPPADGTRAAAPSQPGEEDASPRARRFAREQPAEPDPEFFDAAAAPPAATTEAEARVHGRHLRNGIISLAVVVALVVALLLAVPGLDSVSVRHVDKDTVIAAFALELLSCVGYVLVVQLVFARAPRRFAARLAWSEMAFGAALGFGGAGSLALGAWVLRVKGVPLRRIAERSAVLFLLTSATNVLVLIGFGVLAGLGVVDGSTNPLLTFLPAAVGAAVLAFFLLLPGLAGRAARERERRRPRVAELLFGLADSVRETERMLVKPNWRLAGAWLYLLADICVLYVCLDAVGAHVPFAAVVLAYQIGYLANVVPVPGGIGVLDSGLVGMLLLYGAHAAPATAAVLIYHAIALWVPAVFGTIAFVLLRRSLDQPLVPRTAPVTDPLQ